MAMEKWYSKLDRWVFPSFSKLLNNTVGFFLVILAMIITVTIVSARSTGTIPLWLTGCIEYTQMTMAMMAVVAGGWTWYNGGHLRIGLLRDRWKGRAGAIADAIGTFCTLVYISACFVGVWRLAGYSLASGRGMEAMPMIRLGPFQLVFALLLLYFSLIVLRSFILLLMEISGRKAGRPPLPSPFRGNQVYP